MTREVTLRISSRAVPGYHRKPLHTLAIIPPIAVVWQQTLLAISSRPAASLSCVVLITSFDMMELSRFARFCAGTLFMPLASGLVAWSGLSIVNSDSTHWLRRCKAVIACWPALLGCWLISVSCVASGVAIYRLLPAYRPVANASIARAWRSTLDWPAFLLITFDGSYQSAVPGIAQDLAQLLSPYENNTVFDLSDFCEITRTSSQNDFNSCYRRLPAALSFTIPTIADADITALSTAPAIAQALLAQIFTWFFVASIVWKGAKCSPVGKGEPRRPIAQVLMKVPFWLRHVLIVILHLGLVQLFIVVCTIFFIALPTAMAMPAMMSRIVFAYGLGTTVRFGSAIATELVRSSFLVFGQIYSMRLYGILKRVQ